MKETSAASKRPLPPRPSFSPKNRLPRLTRLKPSSSPEGLDFGTNIRLVAQKIIDKKPDIGLPQLAVEVRSRLGHLSDPQEVFGIISSMLRSRAERIMNRVDFDEHGADEVINALREDGHPGETPEIDISEEELSEEEIRQLGI